MISDSKFYFMEHPQRKNQKPTAIIDKSFLHEVSELSHQERKDVWRAILDKYILVVPFILLEEILVNAINPGTVPKGHIQMMVTDVIQLRPFWMDDIVEYAFRELILGHPITKLIGVPKDMQRMLLELNLIDPDVVNWAQGRKGDRKAVIKQWKNLQQIISPPGGYRIVAGEKEFYQKIFGEFLNIVKNPHVKMEYLEVVLGERFRKRHPASASEIEKAFKEYDDKNCSSFHVTRICLMLRLIYILAPIIRIQNASNQNLRPILNAGNQINNFADEQYVACALLCDRLLTMDQEMKNVADIFHHAGVWPGQAVFFDPQRPVAAQIQSVLT